MSGKPSVSRAIPWPLLGNLLAAILLLLLAWALWRLQPGTWWLAAPPPGRWSLAIASLLAYAGGCAAIYWRSRPHRQKPNADKHDAPAILVAWASQTGFAQQLAERTASELRGVGMNVELHPLEQLDDVRLANTHQALFVVSTTGEGDPPDQALPFLRRVMRQPPALAHLHYAVLALGDREYEDFCAFGHHLDHWFRQQDAQPLFDLVEVDNADAGALRHWQYHLGQLSGGFAMPDWTPPTYESWRLLERRLLNLGSAGNPVFHIALEPPEGVSPRWQAGDIAEIGPRHSTAAVSTWLHENALDGDIRIVSGQQEITLAEHLAGSRLPAIASPTGQTAQAIADALIPLPHREYSIASLPSDGALHLLVRRVTHADGSPGLGSGWLCDHAQPGERIHLRLRNNRYFHPPANECPLILIGNGTGIAGLRAHLKARIAVGSRRNWLLFGERNAEHDFFYRQEIRSWQAQGFIERLDVAFSRDGTEKRYVQDALLAAEDTLRDWIDAGAAVYVCGNLQGMAPRVEAVLDTILGTECRERLQEEDRYRRDVY